MAVRIHFAGLVPGQPLAHLAWAAFAHDERLAGTTDIRFGRELADAFGRHWQVAPSIADCDVVVYAHAYENGPKTATVAEAARAAGKPCLFFSQDERLPPSRLTYGTLYRSSIFQRLPHERSHPVFIHDVRAETNNAYAETLPKEPSPRLGFCGYVGTPFNRMLLRLVGARQKVDGLAFRARVLDAIAKDPRIRCEFIVRKTYLGAAPLAAFDGNHPLADARGTFLDNLFNCPYGLAMRGKGNHSVRFYEILSAGRIPAFVNTACVLPLEGEIDWKAHSFWIEDRDLPAIGDHLIDYHARIDADAFVELQRRNRTLWETRLTPEPYFSHLLHTVASGAPAP